MNVWWINWTKSEGNEENGMKAGSVMTHSRNRERYECNECSELWERKAAGNETEINLI